MGPSNLGDFRSDISEMGFASLALLSMSVTLRDRAALTQKNKTDVARH
jgi:hypothetical protein